MMAEYSVNAREQFQKKIAGAGGALRGRAGTVHHLIRHRLSLSDVSVSRHVSDASESDVREVLSEGQMSRSSFCPYPFL